MAKEVKKRKIFQWFMGALLPLLLVFGYIWPYLGFVVMAMMLTLIIMSFFMGRFWCGWLCMRGGFLERYLRFFSLRKKIPGFLKSNIFRWFIVACLMSFFALQMWLTGGNLEKIGMVFIRMCIITTIIAVPLGMIFKPRAWCAFCPMGTIQGFLGKTRRLLKVADNCSECSLCEKVCPIETNASKYKAQGKVDSKDCIRCENCVLSCPKDVLGM
jgi:ferredoxin-type protein NapH